MRTNLTQNLSVASAANCSASAVRTSLALSESIRSRVIPLLTFSQSAKALFLGVSDAPTMTTGDTAIGVGEIATAAIGESEISESVSILKSLRSN